MRNVSVMPLLLAATLAALSQTGCSSSSAAGRAANTVAHNIGIDIDKVTMGLTVEVRRAPTVPGTRPGTDASAPLEGAHVRVIRGEDVVGDLVTDGEGRAAAQLEPGTYTLQPLPIETSEWPKPPQPVSVIVPRNGKTEAILVYDTGIR